MGATAAVSPQRPALAEGERPDFTFTTAVGSSWRAAWAGAALALGCSSPNPAFDREIAGSGKGSTGASGASETAATQPGDEATRGGSGDPAETGSPSATDEGSGPLPATSTGAPDGPSACCEPTFQPGCDDPEIQACEASVCDVDSACCEVAWDEVCVSRAIEGGACVSGNSCCATANTPGCDDPSVLACVCTSDPFCCGVAFDEQCLAQALECGASCLDPNADCCTAHATPGCNLPNLPQCVCAANPSCCGPQGEWTEDCVTTASVECGACQPCCDTSGYPGCDDAEIVACVCALDAFCCGAQWDVMCVDLVGSCGDACL